MVDKKFVTDYVLHHRKKKFADPRNSADLRRNLFFIAKKLCCYTDYVACMRGMKILRDERARVSILKEKVERRGRLRERALI
ncbi:hypothetical protein TSUD_204430 [Trifolium subterraneum]|uniref:Uncharacterized protein n=1 Tax=Trifolium subterraneum TaxID=3900 RepID=A0A2Z6NRB3_TRISU|nr:hypothetical protein TSUD_204430 [Trifolium subterraneum]